MSEASFHALSPRELLRLLDPEGFFLLGKHVTLTLNWTDGEPGFDWLEFLKRSVPS